MITWTTGSATLNPSPIEPSWIISGSPQARNAVLSRSADRTAVTMAWDCNAGQFHWYYDIDETVHIVEGEVSITTDDKQVAILRPGDVAFFPAGSHAIWQVDRYVRKVAFCRAPPPRFFVLIQRSIGKFLKVVKELGSPRSAGVVDAPGRH